jgi:curved DNA-binding protein CbpA
MDTTSKFSYYDVLELSTHCSHQEVTSAYEKLKMTYASDNPAIYTIFSPEEAKDMLRLIEEAYAVLSNKALRTQYDGKITQTSKPAEPNLTLVPNFSKKKHQLSTPDAKSSVFSKPTFKEDSAFEIEIQSCRNWTGELLRKVREYKNWPLDQLAERTKISAYYIQAIENVEPKGLPASVFVRGYVSQLCKVYALDEKIVCESYMREFKQKLEK